MHIFRSLKEIPQDFGPTVAAIGNFDGVHCGHRYVLGQVLDRARGRNAKAVALTFDPHPIRTLRPGDQRLLRLWPILHVLRAWTDGSKTATCAT